MPKDFSKAKYDHKKIEPKWQKFWEKKGLHEAEDFSKKPKFYCLVEFPYPSGAGLHVGHVRSYSALDAVVRKKRMQGYNVLYPMGWDAFGLPTENYAIKTRQAPQKVTKDNIKIYKGQIKSLGLSFDWQREINTTDPQYYKWTHWIFLLLFKKGLAYQAEMPINWCPACKIGLANEEAIGNKCERCGAETIKKNQKQWMLKITEYAERLLKDLGSVDYLEKIKIQQINWIGRSEGSLLKFPIANSQYQIEIFTTRADTIYGATYLVLSPEHELIDKLHYENQSEVREYVKLAKNKSDLERGDLSQEKTGVELRGIKAVNPASQEEIPIWVADYVLPHYATGAIMAVPDQDQRDREFAEKFSLKIKEIQLVDAKEITKKLGGKLTVNYKLRDWIFSRQHYGGEPIPLIHCAKCGVVPVPEKDLPVELPRVENYQPSNTGESPLSKIDSWVQVKCPECQGIAKRETDTMPNWAGSSWYFLRYLDPKNHKNFAASEKLKYWLPVDLYNGGMEHTTLHLLYSRFWHKFLFDLGLVPHSEPYKRRVSHGMVLGVDGEKMSKSRGNVINPDIYLEKYGADSLRLYEMFLGPFAEAIPWNTASLIGMRRFLERIFKLKPRKANNQITHKTIKKVTGDMDNLKFNTAISALMEYVNSGRYDSEVLLKLLAPFAPHLAEELWSRKHDSSIFQESWPEFDEDLARDNQIEFVIQINGKLKDKIKIKIGISEAEIMTLIKELPKLKNLEIKRSIFIPDKLINLVV